MTKNEIKHLIPGFNSDDFFNLTDPDQVKFTRKQHHYTRNNDGTITIGTSENSSHFIATIVHLNKDDLRWDNQVLSTTDTECPYDIIKIGKVTSSDKMYANNIVKNIPILICFVEDGKRTYQELFFVKAFSDNIAILQHIQK
jgi:hypothetical protein